MPESNETYYLTEEGRQKLQQELEELEGPKREEIARRLKSAIEMGDLSENADYISAKEDQGFIEGKIQEIKHILHHATIVSKHDNGLDTVGVGSMVTVQEDGQPPETFQVVGRKEADPTEHKISYASPIGEALLDKKEGETIAVETPGGKLTFKILKIE